MERVGKLCLCLAGGLVLNTGLRADDFVSADNPYAPIVTRNVFDIHPPPPVDPNAQNAEPPPKITPNGIMSAFGHLQVLFKVAIPAKPGQPAKDQSYILSEGQAQDDIEVTKIDEKGSVVTFNNHGTVQELPLAVATASGPGAPPPAAGRGRDQTFPSRDMRPWAATPVAAAVSYLSAVVSARAAGLAGKIQKSMAAWAATAAASAA